MVMADKMTLSVLGLRARSAWDCARSAHSERCRASLLAGSARKAPRCARFTSNFVHCARAIPKPMIHFVGKAPLLLHANFHCPPTLLATTFRLKMDRLIWYPSHPFWTTILFFLMALMRVIRKFDVNKMFFIHVWCPLYFSFCSSLSKNGRNDGSKGQFWTKS